MACSKDKEELITADSKCAETIVQFFNDPSRDTEELEIEVYTTLERIFEYVNDATNESTVQTKWLKGLKGLWNAQKEHQGESSSRFLDVSVGEKRAVFKILRLEANYKNMGNIESYQSVLSEQEIYDTKEMTASVTVAPKSKLIRWQLVSYVAGYEIRYDHITDTSDENSDKLALVWSKHVAKILVPLKIVYKQTPFRIKHKEQDKFLTIVTRKDWPAAALALDSQCYFVLHDKPPEGIRIKAENTTAPDYDVLYSAESGAIYFDRWTTDLSKQCWTINKADPLFNGATVSFTNKCWGDSVLCFDNGDVSCTKNKGDEWILLTRVKEPEKTIASKETKHE